MKLTLMALEDSDVRFLVLDMLKNPGERDKQHLIGASEIGNPCNYCLACRLQGRTRKENAYWLGAKLGTAMHRELEWEAAKHTLKAQSGRFNALVGALIEQKIILGELSGYGVIKSKPDLVLVNDYHLLDYKSTTKAKVSKYKLDGVPEQYVIQQQLYAWGLNNAGIKIDRISLVFVNRDGSGDRDVWIHSFAYDPEVALKAWARLTNAWEWLEAGGDVESLPSDPNCYYCSQVLNRW